jgi:hypothetical protein
VVGVLPRVRMGCLFGKEDKLMKLRLREYTVYAWSRGRNFTTDYDDYMAGARWRYRVYAKSLDHAVYLARNQRFAADAWLAGIRKIERAWWHYGHSMPQPGDVIEADYLSRTNDVLVSTHSKEGTS